jgi:hypothetical protein
MKSFLSNNNFKTLSVDDIWYAENAFYLRAKPERIIQLTNLYDIYKRISKVKGDIVECGVFKGASFTKLLTFRKFLDNKKKRKAFGFDVFGKFPVPKLKNDKMFLKNWEKTAGDGIKIDELKKYLKNKKFTNFKLIKGDVLETIPKFVKKNKNLKIALLHLDMDVYEGTKCALNYLADKVVKNGIILIDDYKVVHGATKATQEYLKNNINLKIKKVNFYKKPSFIIKDF